jgi:hypothetical protein
MRLVLKSYSQDVDISDPDSASYLLTFVEEESGIEVRLPVQQDTVMQLVRETTKFSRQSTEPVQVSLTRPTPEVEEPQDHPEGAAIFGDEEDYEESDDGVGSL